MRCTFSSSESLPLSPRCQLMSARVSKYPSPGSGRNWELAAAAYVACWLAWIVCVFLLYELAYSFIRRWRVSECPAFSKSAARSLCRTPADYAHLPLCPCPHLCLPHLLPQLPLPAPSASPGLVRRARLHPRRPCRVLLLVLPEPANRRPSPPPRCPLPRPPLRLLCPRSWPPQPRRHLFHTQPGLPQRLCQGHLDRQHPLDRMAHPSPPPQLVRSLDHQCPGLRWSMWSAIQVGRRRQRQDTLLRLF